VACLGSHLNIISQVHAISWWLPTSKGHFQNHVFCDASERAYGSALYIRSTKDNKTLVRLTCSNNRLAPLKKVTLPRLELLAALVGTRFLHYFCKATGYDINQAILRSDATMALGWKRSDPNRWKNFVCNSHENTNTHEPHGMEVLPGAGQPCRPPLTLTPWRQNTVPEYLVARSVMTCTTCGGLDIRNSPDEPPSSRRDKEAYPSHDSNQACRSY